MTTYIIRRFLLMAPTIFLVTLMVFFSVRFIPGSVIDLMMAQMQGEAETGVDPEEMARAIRQSLGMDVAVHVQYGRWLGIAPHDDGRFKGILQGSLGTSLWRKESVLKEIGERLPVSIELGFLAILTGLSISIPIGVNSAIRQDTGRDYIGRTIAILAISLPSFWLGTMVIVFPSIWWGWTPEFELIHFVDNPPGNLIQFILPAIIMGMILSGTAMRMTRTMMLEVLRQDYIRTAWSKGLTERTIVMRHALKNALIPVVTIVGMQIPIIISGTVVIETIFALPGVGRLLIEGLNTRDYPIISGINLVLSGFVMVLNLLVDLTYGYLDPRVVYK